MSFPPPPYRSVGAYYFVEHRDLFLSKKVRWIGWVWPIARMLHEGTRQSEKLYPKEIDVLGYIFAPDKHTVNWARNVSLGYIIGHTMMHIYFAGKDIMDPGMQVCSNTTRFKYFAFCVFESLFFDFLATLGNQFLLAFGTHDFVNKILGGNKPDQNRSTLQKYFPRVFAAAFVLSAGFAFDFLSTGINVMIRKLEILTTCLPPSIEPHYS